MKSIIFTLIALLTFNLGVGQIVAWEMNGNAGNELLVNATTLDSNLNISTLGRGNGLSTHNQGNTFSSLAFMVDGTQTDAIANDEYLEFQISATTGYQVSLTTLDATFRRSTTGPNTFIWRYSTDGINFFDIGIPFSYLTNSGNGTAQAQIDLSGIAALQNVSSGTTITIRLYGWGATHNLGTFAIGKLAGNDLSVQGVVSPIPCPGGTVTWDGTNWTPSIPNLTTEAILNADYNTSTDGGSFSACTLTINSARLTIADNTFVEVQNDLIVNTEGTINVQPQGTFIQNNDLGTVTNNGTIQVDKETAPMNAWYEYTYWSAPVSGAEIGAVLDKSEPKRRFLFNAQNFLDATAETNNDGSSADAQDDVDDDGNDWQWVSGTHIMKPGTGYATTLSKFAYDSALGESEKTFRFTFEGDFNNGEYLVPIYRNDSELDDNNWNLVGNPYPSAIDANLFLAANSNISTDISGTDSNGTSYIDGAIFLWSQNTPPLATNNGNQKFNFSNDDYAIINAMGETAGGDGITPSRNIPSGQGFFVAMSNTAPADLVTGDIYTTNVVFSNSMRVANTTANSQFFKGTKKKSQSAFNKLWLDLTSDNGAFNQILVGYVNGATPKDDGMAYDTPKYANKGAALYSTIENCDKKFAIQGKDVNSINEDEVIKLGFSTTIEVPTLYTLSIPKMEGDFLNSHSVFVKDNLMNKIHDLSACDFTFTSEMGEFNNRFEIVFKDDALSTTNASVNSSQLKIVELENDKVQFTAPQDLKIKSVAIFDLFGRQLYQLQGQNHAEVYKLSNLKNSVYIAKVKLSNGAVISKKAIKK